MTHDELLAEIDFLPLDGLHKWFQPALRAVVELHKPWVGGCSQCIAIDGGYKPYPCDTIQAIEKELG